MGRQKKGRMKLKSLSMKVLIVSLPMLMVVGALGVAVTTIQNNNVADKVISVQINNAMGNLKLDFSNLTRISQTETAEMASDVSLSKAISEGDRDGVKNALALDTSGNLDFVTVTDTKGRVIYCSDGSQVDGDDISALPIYGKNIIRRRKRRDLYRNGKPGFCDFYCQC